ncbi:MAG: hypothetical protein AAF413_04180 [Patescibacteria group bacterium]
MSEKNRNRRLVPKILLAGALLGSLLNPTISEAQSEEAADDLDLLYDSAYLSANMAYNRVLSDGGKMTVIKDLCVYTSVDNVPVEVSNPIVHTTVHHGDFGPVEFTGLYLRDATGQLIMFAHNKRVSLGHYASMSAEVFFDETDITRVTAWAPPTNNPTLNLFDIRPELTSEINYHHLQGTLHIPGGVARTQYPPGYTGHVEAYSPCVSTEIGTI